MLTRQVIRKAVEAALEEDAPNGDITCATTIPPQARGEVRLVARERGVMSGIDVFVAAFKAQNPETVVMQAIADGDRFEPGRTLATVSGPVHDLLTAERVALNFTQRMCGIATMTDTFVAAADQARTLPGYRAPRTYAAPQAAGVIHTDFEKGFIKADIVSYDDFVAADGSMVTIKEEGKLRQEGRDYVMQDGDIVEFKFNVSK